MGLRELKLAKRSGNEINANIEVGCYSSKCVEKQ